MARKEMKAIVSISGVLDKTMTQAVETAKKKISDLSPKTLKAAAAVGSIGTAGFKVGKELATLGGEYQKSMNQMQASTGASQKEMEQLGEVVKNIYGNNLGESMGDVSEAVAEIQRQTKLAGSALQGVAEGGLVLRDTFGYDVTESARAAKAMMTNFGIDGEKAMSMIASGAQNGLDYSGELLDSISEYSVQFAKVGLGADDMFNIFQQGADSGAWNLDKVGDAVKEFSIRAIDGSKSTSSAYQQLGVDAEEMMQIFARGGPQANQAFSDILNKLMDMEDQVERDKVGVALFGTQWEDLGTEAMQALANTEKKVYDVNNAMKGMKDVKYSDLGSAMEDIGRTMEIALLPAASKLAEKLVEMQPTIEKVATFAADNLNIIIPILGGIGVAMGMLKFARLTTEVSGYAKAIQGLSLAKAKDKVETIYLKGLYAKDAITRRGSAAATKMQSFATQLFSRQKMMERMQTLSNIGVMARERVAKMGSTAAQKAHTAATKVGTVVSKGAAVASKALGIAFKFMTGPIGLAITAITAIITVGVLLYKNWDKVKAKASEIAGKIKSTFSNMKKAVVDTFSNLADKIGGAFSKIADVVRTPINAVISLVNKAIGGINEISIDVPDWLGGGSVGFKIPKIPMLETGGMTNGVSIAGEGRYDEMVITPDPRYRAENIGYWRQAGRMLGMDDPSYTLTGAQPSKTVSFGDVVFSPKIEVQGSADKGDIMDALRQVKDEFMDELRQWLEEMEEYVYG